MEKFKILPIIDPNKAKEKERPDKFKELLVNLKGEIYGLKSDEARSKIFKYLESESFKKVNDKELKDSLPITGRIIDNIKDLINQNGSDEKTKKASLEIIKEIEEHCKKYIN